MTQEKINHLETRVGTAEAQIKAMLNGQEKLFLKMDGVMTELHHNTKEMAATAKEFAVMNANMTHQSDTNKRIFSLIDEGKRQTEQKLLLLSKDVRATSDEVTENRTVNKIISKLPIYLITVAISLLGVVGSVFYAIMKTPGTN